MATPQSEHEAQEAWEAAHPERVAQINARTNLDEAIATASDESVASAFWDMGVDEDTDTAVGEQVLDYLSELGNEPQE